MQVALWYLSLFLVYRIGLFILYDIIDKCHYLLFLGFLIENIVALSSHILNEHLQFNFQLAGGLKAYAKLMIHC